MEKLERFPIPGIVIKRVVFLGRLLALQGVGADFQLSFFSFFDIRKTVENN